MKNLTNVLLFSLSITIPGIVGLASDNQDLKTESKRRAPMEMKAPAIVPSTAAAPVFQVICSVEKRDRTITIKTGPNGTVYSVKTADGKVLCENATAQQLQAQAPELHDFIKSAYADSSAIRHDASVRISGGIR